jgi:hypothetical protein
MATAADRHIIFRSGEELYDRRFRERYRVLQTARDTGGELVRVEDTAAPGPSRRPLSAHPLNRSASRCSQEPWG